MAKKRLSLDLDLDDYNDKKIWDYLETKKVKSKAIKSIISAYLDGVEIPKVNIETKDKECLNDRELLNEDDIDPSGFAGF
ncbi:MAG: hypothetical protein IJH55_06830 [Romboutsia sp.]|nr:hypothetical protein [Romboutsia sp.]